MQKHICLVTPGHLSTNPRLVKEADALTAAGYRVSIIAARFISWADEADKEFKNRPWTVHTVAFGPLAGRLPHIIQALRQRICSFLYQAFSQCAEYAFHPAYVDLARITSMVSADLYIAHNLAALPAAARAAKRHKAKLGFDAEDFHSGELNDTPENALRLQLTQKIERLYLPQCNHLTAASPGIARAYQQAYGIKLPIVILNVFPLSEALTNKSKENKRQHPPSLYWFSQTIGSNRGLETVIEAIALSQSKPTLFLRGNLSSDYQDTLVTLAVKYGIKNHLHILYPAPPGDMIRFAMEYDLGLASEPGHTENNRLALSNKLFTFLLAGIPILMSHTPAQAQIATEMEGAVFIYPQQDALFLSKKIDELLSSPLVLAKAQQKALQLGKSRYNWEVEQLTFLKAIESTLI